MIDRCEDECTAGVERKMLAEDWMNSLQGYRNVGSDGCKYRKVTAGLY